MNYSKQQKEIESKEYEILKKLNEIFKFSLTEFITKYSNSLKFINYLTLPIIMASIEDKAYNPFSEIIEKHISYIVNKKMEKNGYKLIPLGYSSDLTFENDEHIINIDIKTANINNPSDFSNEIALGFNQTNYFAKLPSGIRGTREYNPEGINEVKTIPFIPAKYTIDNKQKINLTYGLIFIYPEFKTIMDEIRLDYMNIRELFNSKLENFYKEIFAKNKNRIKEFLNYKPSSEKVKRREIIIDNLIRRYFIHNDKDNKLKNDEVQKLNKFNDALINISEKLSKSEIHPVAIISISIPNGILVPHYNMEIVSGKSWGKSIRYHYNDGKFKGLDGELFKIFYNYSLN